MMSFMRNSGSDFNDRWPRISPIVKRMLDMENVSHTEWHDMFSDVFSLVIWNDASESIEIKLALSGILESYVRDVKQLVMQHQDESDLLKSYIVQWNKFYGCAEYLPLPFMHLETQLNGKHQVNYPSQRKVQGSSVRKLMFEIWDTIIFEGIKFYLMNSATKLIQSERSGQVIDSSLVIGLRDSCVSLTNTPEPAQPRYLVELEEMYIGSTENYYRPLIAQYIQDKGVRVYTAFASQKLVEEEDRGKRYMKTKEAYDTMTNLMSSCVRLFVTEYMDQLLSEVPKLLREHDIHLLRQFYELINRVPDGSIQLLPLFEQYVSQSGLEDIKSNAETIVKDANKYVDRLLYLYNRFSSIVNFAFYNDPLLLASRDKAFQEIVNNTSVFTTEIPISIHSGVRRVESRCSELLASYCDLMLRKSPFNRRLTLDEIEKLLDNVLLVLKYVNNKDIFMRVYKTHLIRRLLLATSVDNEMEESMVGRLRNIGMPAEHINKMSRMFVDIEVSKDLTVSFRNSHKSANVTSAPSGSPLYCSTPLDMVNILILTSGSWVLPAVEKIPISLPSEMEDFLPQIEEFYRSKHQGRNLTWQHHLSHGVLAFTSDHGRFEFELTAHQIVVLFAWNLRFDRTMRLDDLLTATGLQDTELRRILWSLCEHQKLEQQLILYLPKAKSEKEFTESSEFRINLNYSNTKFSKGQGKRRLNLIGRLQLTQEITSEEETVAIVELRQLRAQEAVIKILKARKRLHYNDLYTELVELLRFQFVPSKRLIKEVLEWLIDHQYVRRLDENRDIFVYVT